MAKPSESVTATQVSPMLFLVSRTYLYYLLGLSSRDLVGPPLSVSPTMNQLVETGILKRLYHISRIYRC